MSGQFIRPCDGGRGTLEGFEMRGTFAAATDCGLGRQLQQPRAQDGDAVRALFF
jgi:hypothetical protein